MDNEFGQRLGQYREAAGLSQNALARLVDVDPSYINRMERGEREPPRRELVVRLAEALSLNEADRQRLLLAAGHVPDWLLALEADDPTLLAVGNLLAAPGVSASSKQDFRQVIELLVARWRATDAEA
jgi:transcriptional regulator with XRE-family HTH domain